jgi:iron-sulfur cluster assembly accessory protein
VLTITDKAAEKAKAILAEEGKESWGIRIYQAGSSCCGPSWGLDLEETPAAGDEIFEKDGMRVFVDKENIPALADMQLDFFDDGERAGFILSGGKEQAPPSCSSGCSSCG